MPEQPADPLHYDMKIPPETQEANQESDSGTPAASESPAASQSSSASQSKDQKPDPAIDSDKDAQGTRPGKG